MELGVNTVIRELIVRHGGGVAIHIRTSINFIIRDDLTDDNLETITLEISKPKAKPFLINSWYKPPNTTLEIFNAFEDLITRMDSGNKEIILLGDYNCDWSRLDSNSANAQTNKLAGIAQTFQFQQLISDPTRITAHSKTLIDLAFTNKPELINGSGVIHLGISDHSLIYIQRKISVPHKEPKVIKSRNFKRYNSNNFKSDLSTYLYDQIFCDTMLDPNILWENWKTIFLSVADFHAPETTKKVRSEYAPWITENIKQTMRRRDFLKKKAVKTGSKHFHDAYKRTRNDLNRLIIKNTKAMYFTNTLNDCDNNPKKMWKTINKLTNKQSKTTVISEIRNDNQNLTKKHEIADALNSHFNEVASRLVNNMPQSSRTPESYVTRPDTQFTIQNISLTKVYKLLSTIKTSKSAGHDRIPGKLLRDAAEVIAPSLSAIFNASINTGIFPEDFKVAIIFPIHKAGSKTNCDNYRPISVLSSVAKIYEKLVIEQLEIYLESNHILAEQAGFRKNHSTQTSLLNITNQYLMNMDKGLLNGVIFLDLKKAFDCVDHNIVKKKALLWNKRSYACLVPVLSF